MIQAQRACCWPQLTLVDPQGEDLPEHLELKAWIYDGSVEVLRWEVRRVVFWIGGEQIRMQRALQRDLRGWNVLAQAVCGVQGSRCSVRASADAADVDGQSKENQYASLTVPFLLLLSWLGVHRRLLRERAKCDRLLQQWLQMFVPVEFADEVLGEQALPEGAAQQGCQVPSPGALGCLRCERYMEECSTGGTRWCRLAGRLRWLHQHEGDCMGLHFLLGVVGLAPDGASFGKEETLVIQAYRVSKGYGAWLVPQAPWS